MSSWPSPGSLLRFLFMLSIAWKLYHFSFWNSSFFLIYRLQFSYIHFCFSWSFWLPFWIQRLYYIFNYFFLSAQSFYLISVNGHSIFLPGISLPGPACPDLDLVIFWKCYPAVITAPSMVDLYSAAILV